MISAILRLLHAGWRRSLTRMTETLTVCALAVAGVFPLLHIGRNWVFLLDAALPERAAVLAELQKPAALGCDGDLRVSDHERDLLVRRPDPGLRHPARPDVRLAAGSVHGSVLWAGAGRTGNGGG